MYLKCFPVRNLIEVTRIVRPLDDEAYVSINTPEIEKVLHWLDNFIMKPHEDLNRAGHVCPFVEPAIKEGKLYLTIQDLNDTNNLDELHKNLLIELPLLAEKVFKEKTGPTNPLSLESIIILLPELKNHPQAANFLDNLQKDLKTALLRKGLTCGQFYENNKKESTRNPAFYSFVSPVPSIVIRHLINADDRFMHSNATSDRNYYWKHLYKAHFSN